MCYLADTVPKNTERLCITNLTEKEYEQIQIALVYYASTIVAKEEHREAYRNVHGAQLKVLLATEDKF